MSNATTLELRIDWSEIDALGHVNNLAIMKYVQACRVEYLESIGLLPLHSEAGMGPILASIGCQFRKPLFYPGRVTVHSRVDAVKNTSFHIRYELRNDHGEVFAEAADVIVFFDFSRGTKAAIPRDLREKIQGAD